ncbi:hypothetical protein DEA98_07015 [Brucella pseudogrignonensis]|nr:hypothetical protein [Brucella pseudogrignonensis]
MANISNPEYSFQLELDCPHCKRGVDFVVRQVFDWSIYRQEQANEFFSKPLSASLLTAVQ